MSLATALPDGVRRAGAALRVALAALVLAVLLWRFGTGPFADAWRVTTWGSVTAALVLTAGATLANAWRWRVIARALGAPLTPAASVAAYYRSQFLNTTLPGGVLGDAHRGVRHGRDAGQLAVGLRATGWDRVTGQVVQMGLLVGALAVLPTPLRGYAPVALAGLGVVAALGWWLGRCLARRGGPAAFVGADLRALARPGVAARVVLASCLSAAGHASVFLVAVATVGVGSEPSLLAVIALTVLVGAAVPLNVAGWGPREGITAGIFAVAGLGSATGLTVSVVFGVLAAVATVPGLLVLAGDAVVRRRRPVDAVPGRMLEAAHRG
jgi:glycosyltransferase 2 family protein